MFGLVIRAPDSMLTVVTKRILNQSKFNSLKLTLEHHD